MLRVVTTGESTYKANNPISSLLFGRRSILNFANSRAHTNKDKLATTVLSILGMPGASNQVPTGSNRKPPKVAQTIAFFEDNV